MTPANTHAAGSPQPSRADVHLRSSGRTSQDCRDLGKAPNTDDGMGIGAVEEHERVAIFIGRGAGRIDYAVR